MASKKKSENSGKRKKFTDYKGTKWVLNNLDSEQLSIVDDIELDPVRMMEFWELCVDRGLEVKMGWDDYSSTYKVTAYGGWLGFTNTGYATQGRSPILQDAIKILWFKISELCDWDLSSMYVERPDRGFRG